MFRQYFFIIVILFNFVVNCYGGNNEVKYLVSPFNKMYVGEKEYVSNKIKNHRIKNDIRHVEYKNFEINSTREKIIFYNKPENKKYSSDIQSLQSTAELIGVAEVNGKIYFAVSTCSFNTVDILIYVSNGHIVKKPAKGDKYSHKIYDFFSKRQGV